MNYHDLLEVYSRLMLLVHQVSNNNKKEKELGLLEKKKIFFLFKLLFTSTKSSTTSSSISCKIDSSVSGSGPKYEGKFSWNHLCSLFFFETKKTFLFIYVFFLKKKTLFLELKFF